MSYLSLPRVLSNQSSRNSSGKKLNSSSLNRTAGHETRSVRKVLSTLSLNETGERRKRILNRNGSISSQHFRGVHKNLLESHAKAVCHSMTVSKYLVYTEELFYLPLHEYSYLCFLETFFKVV